MMRGKTESQLSKRFRVIFRRRKVKRSACECLPKFEWKQGYKIIWGLMWIEHLSCSWCSWNTWSDTSWQIRICCGHYFQTLEFKGIDGTEMSWIYCVGWANKLYRTVDRNKIKLKDHTYWILRFNQHLNRMSLELQESIT